MSLPAKIQLPGNVVSGADHLDAILDDGTAVEIPIVSSGYVIEGVSIPATKPLKAVYLADPAEPGDCEINYPSGRAAIALGASAVVITNSLVTAASMCFIAPLANDATLLTWKAVCTANTITVTGGAAATADWPFYFFIVQQVAP